MLAVALGLTACEPTDTVQGSSDAPAPSSADARFEDNSEEPELDPDAYQTARRPYTAWGGEVELYFTRPGTQRGEEEDPEADDAIADAIRNAQTSVDLCLYEFNRQNIVDAVIEAHQRGVQIRFAGDGDELHDEGYIELDNNGVVLKYRKPHDRIMHNKFVVIDDEVVFTGSMNMSENGVNLNNNHVLKITDSDVAALYKAEFEQMYMLEKFGRGKTSVPMGRDVSIGATSAQVYFSPRDDIDQKMLELLDTADVRVYFMIFSFTHEAISGRLVDLHDSGVEVAGIFDESQARGRYSKDEFLAQAGLPVFIDGNENAIGFAGGKLHHKVMLIDPGTDSDPTVVVGSYNWSNNATLYNDENIIVLRGPELVSPFLDEFCQLLDVAVIHEEFAGNAPNPCANLVTPVRINEFMPNPEGADGPNEWVEIVNPGAAPVNLEGWTLGDGLDPARHTFESLILPPQGSVVVYAGSNPEEPERIVSTTGYLGLANNIDSVRLTRPDGVLVDEVAYEGARAGVSFNRNPDGGEDGDFVLHTDLGMLDASPGRRADGSRWPGEPNLIINEVLPNPSGADTGQEYIEIVNVGSARVDLAGWKLGDLASEDRHVFETRYIEPNEALVIFDRGDHSATPNAINSSSQTLSLNNTGDSIFLRDPRGKIMDQFDYGNSSEGVSWNRESDGARSAIVQHTEVMNAAGGNSPGLRVNGGLFAASLERRVIINELLPNPSGTDTGEEFIEIVNVGTEPVSLDGWSVRDATAERHVFPPDAMLPPGGVFVLYDSGDHSNLSSAITSTTGSLSLNNSGDLIELLEADGTTHDAVQYSSSRDGVSLNRSPDGEAGAPMDHHSDLLTSASDLSPGTRADGSAW